jgi:predicted dehydrogenase
MISETAYFVKDVIGPKGSVSIVSGESAGSSDIDSHTKTNRLLVHRVESHDREDHGDQVLDMADEPGHDDLCRREQEFFLRAILEDLDLTGHVTDAVRSLQIVLAADQSVREHSVVGIPAAE